MAVASYPEPPGVLAKVGGEDTRAGMHEVAM
jgi:hypothetical protein